MQCWSELSEDETGWDHLIWRPVAVLRVFDMLRRGDRRRLSGELSGLPGEGTIVRTLHLDADVASVKPEGRPGARRRGTGGRMDGSTLAGRWQGPPVGTSRGAPLLPGCLAVPGAAKPRSHRARDRQRDGRTWIAPGDREQRTDCWPGLGPILSILGTLPALTRPRAILLGWSSRSAAVVALASGIRIQGRELKKVPEPSGIRSRQPGNAWYDQILVVKLSGRLTIIDICGRCVCRSGPRFPASGEPAEE